LCEYQQQQQQQQHENVPRFMRFSSVFQQVSRLYGNIIVLQTFGAALILNIQ
jgi:hypothetical protein